MALQLANFCVMLVLLLGHFLQGLEFFKSELKIEPLTLGLARGSHTFGLCPAGGESLLYSLDSPMQLQSSDGGPQEATESTGLMMFSQLGHLHSCFGMPLAILLAGGLFMNPVTPGKRFHKGMFSSPIE